MRLKKLAGVILLILAGAGQAAAAELKVLESAITTAVVERRPVDVVEAIPAFGGDLFCFTRIAGAEEETFVEHRWYRGEELVSTSQLPVKSSYWRTYSLKTVAPEMAGEWRVDVVDSEGVVLKSLKFTLQ